MQATLFFDGLTARTIAASQGLGQTSDKTKIRIMPTYSKSLVPYIFKANPSLPGTRAANATALKTTNIIPERSSLPYWPPQAY